VSEQPRVGDPAAPKEIDRATVLGELEYRFPASAANNAIAWVLDELAELDILRFRESADDPRKDPIWTVRTVEPAPAMADGNTVVKFGDSFWLYPSKLGNGYGRLDWATVADSRVIGVVPGTPAAEQSVSVEQVAQWETDDLELGDDGSEGYARAVAEPQGWEPRVFHSDGAEPPADVEALEWIDIPDPKLQYRYLVRVADGWLWSQSSADVTPDFGASPARWTTAVGTNPGRYREVQP
jgi:hypothetical protein